MTTPPVKVDVLCVGHACYDLVFSVAKHPESDEKVFADNLVGCGGGPAANAAIAVSRLGYKAAFAGYLGQDLYGEMHHQELMDHHVNTQLVVRDSSPTPLSTVLVKPDGKRALINYKGSTKPLLADAIDFSSVKAKVILFDGHEPCLSLSLVEFARDNGIPTVLDAGSLHEGTSKLSSRVDYLVASEKFARQFAGDVKTALTRLSELSPTVVITLGDKGLIWQRGRQSGSLAAFPVTAIDTTGAGDAFHGAFAAAVAANMEWLDILRYSSAAGALCCTKIGARQGLPCKESVESYFCSK
ncbi:MAG: carbohydrate kinase [Methylococcales bacterium]|nr:carbohydrate kinase [Methylococcales bacterium]